MNHTKEVKKMVTKVKTTMILWIKRKFFDHWWKAISLAFSSPYFLDDNGEVARYQVEQCKHCGLLRTRELWR